MQKIDVEDNGLPPGSLLCVCPPSSHPSSVSAWYQLPSGGPGPCLPLLPVSDINPLLRSIIPDQGQWNVDRLEERFKEILQEEEEVRVAPLH